MTVLTLGTLGPFRASLGQTPLTDFRTRKVQALLIYLATEPRPQRRDLLMDLLWPGMPERSARSNLRQVLYYLRQVLPEVSRRRRQWRGARHRQPPAYPAQSPGRRPRGHAAA
jgi:DNA-binding SARP family transcriptional activator